MTRNRPKGSHAHQPAGAIAAAAAVMLAAAALTYALGARLLAVAFLGAGLYSAGVATALAAARQAAEEDGGAYLVRLDLEARRWRVIPAAGVRPVHATRVARAIVAELDHLAPTGHITIDRPPPGAHRGLTFPSDEDPAR